MSDPILNVVSFSGGQTSGYMLRRLMDENPDFDDRFMVVFENTGKEHDATLDFVRDVEKEWGVKVVWLEYTRVPAIEIDAEMVPEGRKRKNLLDKQQSGETDHWFKVVSHQTARRRFDAGTPFDELLGWANVLPNVRTRMCSVQLKLRTRDRFLRSIGVREFNAFIGIRADEAHRKIEILANSEKWETPIFPLIESGTTKETVDEFWMSNSFRLNIPNHLGNCDLCFLKARWKRIAIARAEPLAADWWKTWEDRFENKTTGAGNRFKPGQGYAELISEALHPEFKLDFSEEDIACSCATGGYRGNQDDDLA